MAITSKCGVVNIGASWDPTSGHILCRKDNIIMIMIEKGYITIIKVNSLKMKGLKKAMGK